LVGDFGGARTMIDLIDTFHPRVVFHPDLVPDVGRVDRVARNA
jgi:hypothetical protein